MKTFNFRKFAATIVIGLVALLGSSVITNAQNNRRNDDRKQVKQQQKAAKQNARAEQERLRVERERQAYWNQQNSRIQNDQRRRTEQYDRTRSGNDRSNGAGFIWGNANANTNRDGRYRVYRNGSYYNTDYRGAELLRQAVNEGYRQGFQAGRNDRNSSRRTSWTNSSVYRSGSIGYQTHVARSQYQYYFQQGFQRGYQDGSNSRYQNDYQGQYEYGYQENGSMNILGTILGSILNIQSY